MKFMHNPQQRAKNISNVFAASLGVEKTAESFDYELHNSEIGLQKYAGIDVYQPTIENIEKSVRSYTLNQLKFLGISPNFGIQIYPVSMDKTNDEWVSSGSGEVLIKFCKKIIRLPFQIEDGAFTPFDIIQVDGQRCPYSAENISKIFAGLQKLEKDNNNERNLSPFQGVEDRVNPSTAPGFLGSTLRIRDNQLSGNHGNARYIFAACTLDDWMDKIASVQEITMEHIHKVEHMFQRKEQTKYEEQLKKIAKEKDEGFELFDNLSSHNFEQAYDLPNGSNIKFPERKGNELTMGYGKICGDFLSIGNAKFPERMRVLITTDGRIKILSQSEKFLCNRINTELHFPETSLSSVAEGSVVTAFDESGKILYPCRLTSVYTPDIYFRDNDVDVEKSIFGSSNSRVADDNSVYHLSTLRANDNLMELFTQSETDKVFQGEANFSIAMLEGGKFRMIPYGDFIEKKSKEIGLDPLLTAGIYTKGSMDIFVLKNSDDWKSKSKADGMTIVTSPDTKFVVIKGVVTDYCSDPNDIMKLANYEDEAFLEKNASKKATLKITLRDRDRKLYDVLVAYKAENTLMLSNKIKEYKGLSQQDLRELMKVLRFPSQDISEAIYRVGNQSPLMVQVPDGADFNMLQGTKIRSAAVESMKKGIRSLIKPQEIARSLSSSIVGNILADTILASPGKVQDIFSRIAKFAEEAKDLSASFEKIACEKQLSSAYDCAALFSVSAQMMDKVASTMTGTHVYPSLPDFGYDVLKHHDVLEKMAYDCLEARAKQLHDGKQIIENELLRKAVDGIDIFQKVAYAMASLHYNDVDDVLEKEASIDFSKMTPQRLHRIAGRVSKRTGLSEDAIIGIVNGTKKASEVFKKKANEFEDGKEKTAGLGVTKGALLGGTFLGAKKYSDTMQKAKANNPNALPSDYSSEALGNTVTGAAIGTAGGALVGGIIKKIKKSGVPKIK